MTSLATTYLFLAAEGMDWSQIVVLLLFLFFGLGKAIMDKVRESKKPARPRRTQPPPTVNPPRAGPATSSGSAGPVDDVEELWKDVVILADEQRPASSPAPAARPPTREAAPLGVDLLEVEDELPSHHEEYFESHAAPAGGGAQRPSVMHHAAAPGASARRLSVGAQLHELAGDRGSWRRAIVLSEVLGAPVALRRSEHLPGLQ